MFVSAILSIVTCVLIFQPAMSVPLDTIEKLTVNARCVPKIVVTASSTSCTQNLNARNALVTYLV